MNKSDKLVHSVGINDNKYISWKEGATVREYIAWSSMLLRCKKKFWETNQAYIGCTVSENFKNYSFFYEWCNKQIGFKNKDESGKIWQLDKDLLIKDNKLYSEDTCVFIPSRLNSLLVKSDRSRGDFPIGVSWCKRDNVFVSKCSNRARKQTRLGGFKTAQEAFQAYKTFKEALIKDVANEYKEQLDSRVYEALMNYEVNEND